MTKMLEGKVALVTGATSGIGKAIAQLYSLNGAQVMVSGRNETKGRQVVEEIQTNGGTADFFKADVNDPDQCRLLVEKTVSVFGSLDIACNNAGIAPSLSSVADYPIQTWKEVIDTNLNSVFYCLKYQLQVMLQQKNGGTVVNMASVTSKIGLENGSSYVAAKHGILGLTKTAALEYATTGIRINAVGPAFIDTPLLAVYPAEVTDMLHNAQPVGRMGKVEEVAELVVWLSSDKASFVTGSFYPVDGGYLAR